MEKITKIPSFKATEKEHTLNMDTKKFIPEYRRTSYKNKDRFNPGEIRRRRDEFRVKLRKERQYQLLEKRRFEDTSSQSASSSSNSGKSGSGYGSDLDEPQILPSLQSLQTELTQWETTLNNSYDLQEQLGALVRVRQLILENNNLTLSDTTMNIIFKYMKDCSLPMLQYEALWAINNLSSGSHSRVATLINNKIIQTLFNLFQKGKCDLECQEHIIWTLGNIAGDCPEYRKLLYAQDPGVINLLVEVVMSWNIKELTGIKIPVSLRKITSWTFSNVFKSFESYHLSQLNTHFITVLKTLLSSDDSEVVSNICWALSYLSNKNVELANSLIINSEILPQLIHILQQHDINITIPGLKVLGSISSGTDAQTQSLIDNNILSVFKDLVNTFDANEYIIKQIYWIISNIVAGSSNQLKLVIQQGLIPKIVASLKPEASYMVRKEACWVICNIISRKDLTLEIFQYMLLQRFITPLYRFIPDADPMLQNIILNTLEIIFQFGKRETENDSQLSFNMFSSFIDQSCGTDILQDIQSNSSNEELSSKAAYLLDTYFNSNENDVEIDSKEPSLIPKVDGDRFQFEY
ncbi:Importin alpha subunit (Karyopherin alpha subunit) (Serine-rich RNA polymerase I suppressor protein) [Monosporozyma unispora]|nr:Importin alpha subunit (Karyopherin alpha subunit) (Serine-rich RNA polymerase I suppressor protein) [Kazachstania unispora]